MHREMKIIAMRPRQRGAKLLVPRPARLEPRQQRLGRGLRKIRLVTEARRLRPVAQLRIGLLQAGPNLPQPGLAPGNELRRRRREDLLESRQFRLPRPTALEEAVPLGQRLAVGLQHPQITGVHRRQRQVQPAPSQRRRAPHQLQILGGENHRRKPAQVIRQPRNPRLVAPQFLAVVSQLDRDVRVALLFVLQLGGDGRALLAVADEELVVRRAERPQRREEARRFEQVGLSLPVRADEELLPAGKLERGKAHVSKMPQRDFFQAHTGRAQEETETRPSQPMEDGLRNPAQPPLTFPADFADQPG